MNSSRPASRFKVVSFVNFIFLWVLLACAHAIAQTSSTGTVVGNIKDITGNNIPSASVVLSSPARGLHQETTSSSLGTYSFVQIEPGEYDITVTKEGFRQIIAHVTVNVSQSTLLDATLPVGEASEHVEVNASDSQVSLQTTNTSIGDVVQHEEIVSLPTVQRQVTQLAYLQPGTTPLIGGAEGSSGGGTIAGGRSDQNNITLDGIDITDKSEGGYLVPGQIASFPLPVDAIQEFRGVVANPGTDQNRSGGGAFALTIRRGANPYHGLIYDYYQNAALNANTWTGNYTKNRRPGLISDRFGGTFSGPLHKDKTFIFFAYEGYRFPQSVTASRIGISDAFRNGALSFTDGSGVVRSYNLNSANGPISSACGATGTSTCDSRGIGLNPLIKQYFSFYPKANLASGGDTLNTQGITGNVRVPITSDFAVARLDHNLTPKWRLFAYYLLEQINQSTADQLDFDPLVTGGQNLISTSQLPVKPTVIVGGATGLLTQNLTYDLRIGFNKQGFNFKRETPQTLLPTAGYAIQLDGTGLDQPGASSVNALTKEGARTQELQFNNTVNWVKHNHIVNGGVNYQHVDLYHYRLSSSGTTAVPVAQMTSSFSSIAAANRPPTCSTALTTNCIRTADLASYNTLYATMIGQWDSTSYFNSRDVNGKAVDSLSHPPSYDQTTEHFEFTGGDVWQLKPSLTASYGVTLTYDTPHRDVDGKDYLLVDGSQQIINPYDMLKSRQAAAATGAGYSSSIGFVHPAQVGGRATYPAPLLWNPRAGLAWNPSPTNKGMRSIFGDRKTVLRGGYALVHDQILGIQTELYGIIGNQLIASANNITAPTCAAAGTPGAGCVAGSSPFRVGVDGQVFINGASPFSIPYYPAAANAVSGQAFGVTSGYGLDPNFHPGHYHSFDFTVQREIPGQAQIEMGWIGRFGRELASAANVNAPPINIVDMSQKSTQTFAQAFDVIAGQLRAGTAAASVTAQPWFENNYGAGGTAKFAAAQTSNITSSNISTLWTSWVDPQLELLGKSAILNRQFQTLNYQTTQGLLNYDAAFVSVRKRSHGFSTVFNYTFAKCLDYHSAQSDSLNGRLDNPYNPRYGYGPCLGAPKHVVQAYGLYDLPTKLGNSFVRHVVGGWSTSYIVTANTGLPLEVLQGNIGGMSTSAVLVGKAPAVSRHQNVTNVNGTTSLYNIFANPQDAISHYRYINIATDTFRSNRGTIFGLGAWNADVNVGRTFAYKERIRAKLGFDLFNVFNHANLVTPALNLNSSATFGQITSDTAGGQSNIGIGARRVQTSLRIEF